MNVWRILSQLGSYWSQQTWGTRAIRELLNYMGGNLSATCRARLSIVPPLTPSDHCPNPKELLYRVKGSSGLDFGMLKD